ncbi:hypothetical protein PHLGIDRAFT_112006 [Phlebiopsis gigantea 11061_1 CR5-6]|uniref:EKC/KEOPS complex subunit GON7 n=1 Tax=Phlebiopsis gigantea (strain 11061_1 CR5-6) TaxID=745531 RepID=A0A0C3S3M1_PHLG1|nr:hypothetical protein PHLGIDRAFT_112006 [Phlebiopsis gigantea 11061_1 CR5-6]
MSKNITITYELSPPADTPAPSLDKSRTLDFAVPEKTELKAYYSGVREAIEKARNAVGEELTVWRDAVGSRELTREPKVVKKDDDEDDGEEDDEEE